MRRFGSRDRGVQLREGRGRAVKPAHQGLDRGLLRGAELGEGGVFGDAQGRPLGHRAGDLRPRRLDDPGTQLSQVRLMLGPQRRERGRESCIRRDGLAVYPQQVLLGGHGVQQHLRLGRHAGRRAEHRRALAGAQREDQGQRHGRRDEQLTPRQQRSGFPGLGSGPLNCADGRKSGCAPATISAITAARQAPSGGVGGTPRVGITRVRLSIDAEGRPVVSPHQSPCLPGAGSKPSSIRPMSPSGTSPRANSSTPRIWAAYAINAY